MTATAALSQAIAAYGFELLQSSDIPELNQTLYQLRHEATGAHWVHLANSDDNNLFAVTLRTPPQDSTGIAHILEHTVLCGSKHFPVHDPFFSMLKRSLNSFMNALTASDWTCYPFATQNRQDFKNLLSIYLDAVFFPLLRERDFRQEGHRLEFKEPQNPDSGLERRGVVYNEMQGAMADPASLLHRRTTQYLYPHSCYHYNSGGEPDQIPRLSHADLVAFHQRFYHPANAYFFTYGNMPLAEHLQQVHEQVLQQFSPLQVESSVASEPRWHQPQQVRETFPSDREEPGQSMLHLAWLTCDIDSIQERLGLTLLHQLLLGHPGAPLYHALLTSGLGSQLTPGSGYQDEFRTTHFGVGLQGTDAKQQEAIERLVFDTLSQIRQEGFAPQRVEAALHRLEFSHREVRGDRFPYPLLLLLTQLGSWIHTDDPLSPLQLDKHLASLRRNLEQGDYLEGLLDTYLLDNPHYLRLLLEPDSHQQQRQEQQRQQELAQLQKQLSPDQQQQLLQQAAELQQAQEAQEDLSCLPTLKVGDIDAQEPQTPQEETEAGGQRLLWHPQPTNGIAYASLYFPLDAVAPAEQPYISLFCSLLTQLGAGGRDYQQVAGLLEAQTGGVSAEALVLDDPARLNQYQAWVKLSGKALVRQHENLWQRLLDFCNSPDFSDRQRLRTVLGQLQTNFENAIADNGHSFASKAAAAQLSPAAGLRECWSGLSQLQRLRQINSDDKQLEKLITTCQCLSQAILQHPQAVICLCGEAKQQHKLVADVAQHAPQRRQHKLGHNQGQPHWQPQQQPQAFTYSVPVAYVAQVHSGQAFSGPYSASLTVLSKLLRSEYLHREIREKGGAYGGLASYSPMSGQFSLLSYRDPHIQRTLETYRAALDWAARGEFSDQAVQEAILAVFSDWDRPLSPAGRAGQACRRKLQGITQEQLQQFRQGLLATTKGALQETAHWLQHHSQQCQGILAGAEAMDQAQEAMQTQWQVTRL